MPSNSLDIKLSTVDLGGIEAKISALVAFLIEPTSRAGPEFLGSKYFSVSSFDHSLYSVESFNPEIYGGHR